MHISPKSALTLAALAALGLAAARPAAAQTDTVDFTYSLAGVTEASGSFTYNAALDGTVLSYSSLNSYNIDALGVNYNLAYLSNPADFVPYYYFQFDSSSDTFVPGNIGGFNVAQAAIKTDFSSGFFINPLGLGDSIHEYSTSTISSFDTLTISKTFNPVPEVSTTVSLGVLLLLGLGGVMLTAKKKNMA